MHKLKLKHAVSMSDLYLWEEVRRQISEQTCRLKQHSKFSLNLSVLEVYSFNLIQKDKLLFPTYLLHLPLQNSG